MPGKYPTTAERPLVPRLRFVYTPPSPCPSKFNIVSMEMDTDSSKPILFIKVSVKKTKGKNSDVEKKAPDLQSGLI